jgi:alkaline phosphatase D
MHDDPLERLIRDGRLSRRELLARGGQLLGLAFLATTPGCVASAFRRAAIPRWAGNPFTLGVASGDPTPDGVVLWTRLAPDPLDGGGLGPDPVPVQWELATDPQFARVVQRGDALAVAELAHSVHVEVDGLQPARDYWYRFTAGDARTEVARTRTAPAAGAAVDRMRFAFVSCQNYQQGYYTAYRHLADEEIDLVVHLGDYIYESGVLADAPRKHEGPEVATLEAYRNRYARYKTDADLQAAHRTAPFVVTWDDHEVANNYAGEHDARGTDPAVFLRRRAAAYQAYYEHMPLRRAFMPKGPDLRLYRRFEYGTLLGLNVLDTRQYRTDQPCDDGTKPACPGMYDPNAQILGAAQERWLLDGLPRSGATWNVLANQVPFVPTQRKVRGEAVYSMDKWDGYAVQQRRVAQVLASGPVRNPVILTGDVHVSWVADLPKELADPTSAAVATEFVGTSISSGGNGAPLPGWGRTMLENNPHMKFFNGERGYVRCTVTPERWTADYRVVPYVDKPGAPVETAGSFVVEAGKGGVQRA